MLTIRDVRPTEHELLKTLVIDAYREYAKPLGDLWPDFEAALGDVDHWSNAAQLLAADLEGQMVGSVAYFAPGHSDPTLYQPEWASIRVLAVAREHRGKG